MKFCPNCGEKLSEAAVFCPNCGSAIKKTSEVNEQKESLSTAEQLIDLESEIQIQEKTPEKKKNNKLFIILGSIVAIGAIVAVMARLFSNGSIGGPKVVKVAENKEKAASGTVFSYRNGDYYGLMNDKLEIIDEKASKQPMIFNQFGVAPFTLDDEYWGIKDKTGEVIKRPFASSIGASPNINVNFSQQSSNGIMMYSEYFNEYDEDEEDWYDRYGSGLINPEGEIIVKAKPERSFMSFNKNNHFVFYDEDGYSGIMTETGEVVLEANYESLSILTDKLISMKENEDDQYYHIIDFEGNMVEEKFSEEDTYVLPGKANYLLTKNRAGKSVLYDEKLNVVSEDFPGILASSSFDNKYFNFSNDGEGMGITNTKGEEVIPAFYDYIEAPNEKGVTVAYKGNNYYLVDMEDNQIYESKNPIEKIFQTNLFIVGDYESNRYEILNSKGEEIVYYKDVPKEKILSASYQSFSLGLDKMFLLSVTTPIKESSYDLYNLYDYEGNELATNIIYVCDLGETFFTQDNQGTVALIKKKNGKVINEKEIQVDRPTATTDSSFY